MQYKMEVASKYSYNTGWFSSLAPPLNWIDPTPFRKLTAPPLLHILSTNFYKGPGHTQAMLLWFGLLVTCKLCWCQWVVTQRPCRECFATPQSWWCWGRRRTSCTPPGPGRSAWPGSGLPPSRTRTKRPWPFNPFYSSCMALFTRPWHPGYGSIDLYKRAWWLDNSL